MVTDVFQAGLYRFDALRAQYLDVFLQPASYESYDCHPLEDLWREVKHQQRFCTSIQTLRGLIRALVSACLMRYSSLAT